MKDLGFRWATSPRYQENQGDRQVGPGQHLRQTFVAIRGPTLQQITQARKLLFAVSSSILGADAERLQELGPRFTDLRPFGFVGFVCLCCVCVSGVLCVCVEADVKLAEADKELGAVRLLWVR